jgi:Transposase and inactivated derivatives
MTYRFIEEHKDRWPVRLLCETLEVSPTGYYAWRQRPRSAREQRQDTVLVEMRAIHAQFKARYGSPRMHKELVARGHDCCVNTVARLMRDHGIVAKSARKFRVTTTDSNHDLPVADNLLDRQFNPSEANEVWLADITYIPTREGWLYLAAVEDLFSRRSSAGRWPSTWRAAWSWMLWRWPCSDACPTRGCWPTPTGAVSTPASTTSSSWLGMGSPAA